MNNTKFYKPVLAALTKKELAFAKVSLAEQYRRKTGLDVPGFDFALPGTSHPVMTRRMGLKHSNRPEDFEPEFFDMGPFQITYNFSRAVRRNDFPVMNALFKRPKVKKEYGAPGWSFRMLYEFLCEAYNGGVPFIDTYFGQVFKTRPVYDSLLTVYKFIEHDIGMERARIIALLPKKKDGTPDMRYTVSKKYADFKVWQDPVVKRDCEEIARGIRRDIEVCLSTGRLPLRGKEGATVSEKTKKLRAELGGMVHADRLFYASDQLIRHLNIYVEVGDVAA